MIRIIHSIFLSSCASTARMAVCASWDVVIRGVTVGKADVAKLFAREISAGGLLPSIAISTDPVVGLVAPVIYKNEDPRFVRIAVNI